MHLLALLFNPAIIGMLALFFSVIWMLRDEKDKTRPLLVFALIVNLFFGTFLTIFMAKEGGFLPWKYDHFLYLLDMSLGITSTSIAIPLQGSLRGSLSIIYMMLVPMMIFWAMVNKYCKSRGSVVLAYIAELVAGPLLYAVLPACGPVYAFGTMWLHPPAVQANTIRLSSMPNAFPSLHIGTAFVFVLFAPNQFWRAIALTFLAGTALATISTGEHYVIDLISGLAFGCFASNIGHKRYKRALLYLLLVLLWSFSIRFNFAFLFDHRLILRSGAIFTILAAVLEIFLEWNKSVTTSEILA